MTRVEKLMPLADGTRSSAEVAKAMGITQRHLYKAITYAKSQGHKPKFRPERNGDDPIYIKVAKALQADPTLTSARLAAILKVSRGSVTNAVSTARAQGFTVQLHLSPGAGVITKRLPPKVAAWLSAQVPEGSSEADLIRAIILDAYHEETGK